MNNISDVLRDRLAKAEEHREYIIKNVRIYEDAYKKATSELVATEAAIKELKSICTELNINRYETEDGNDTEDKS